MFNWINNISISKRLAITFSTTLTLSVIAIAVGIYKLNSVAESTRAMTSGAVTTERLISDWYRNVHTGIRRATAIARSADPTLGAYFSEEQSASTKASSEFQKAVESKLETLEEKTIFSEIGEKRKIYLSSRDKIVALKKEGKSEEANRVLDNEFVPGSRIYLEKMDALLDLKRKQIDATAKAIDEINANSRVLMIVLGTLCVVCSATFIWFLAKSITIPIDKANRLTQSIANGDLTSQVEYVGDNELVQLLKNLEAMQKSLIRLITNVRDGSLSVANASAEIAQGNSDLSSRTEQQAATIEETASSTEEIMSTVIRNAENAINANQLAQKASDIAAEGGNVVSQVVTTMADINDSSKKIVDIISVIDGIAFQTNILALNAAVEAARAGEQGRGFAVVATEVRNLAQRSAAAAKEIKTLISDSVNKVETGSKLVAEAGKTMAEVVSSIRKVNEIVTSITNSSQHQSQEIEQINRAVVEMDNATQQNAALVEEAAAAASEMQDQAGQLANLVSFFKLGESSHLIAAPVNKSTTLSMNKRQRPVRMPV